MKIDNAKLSVFENNLSSVIFNDIYHSSTGALQESLYVFIQGNKLMERWSLAHESDRFSIAEIGFGSGLNFLLTCRSWKEQVQKPGRLFYTAFEKYPITKTDLTTIYKKWPHLSKDSDAFLKIYPDHTAGCHRLLIDNDITLDLHFGCASKSIDCIKAGSQLGANSWFLDGFSPDRNPDLWTFELFKKLAFHSAPGCTLSTYTSAGSVARKLRAAGFRIKKISGFGKKRHSLVGILEKPKLISSSVSKSPWLNIATSKTFAAEPKKAAIIGAGLAGGTTALALARRGWKVTVLEAASTVLQGASGIDQLALRCRLISEKSSLALFFLHSYLFSQRYYSLLNNGSSWNQTGLLQLINATNKKKALEVTKILEIYDPQVVHLMRSEIAASLAGLNLRKTNTDNDSLYFPKGGWIESADLSKNLLTHPNITVCLNHPVDQITRVNDTWMLTSDRKNPISSRVVVVASSFATKKFDGLKSLPLQEIYGQATQIQMSKTSKDLSKVICGERSIFPQNRGHHTISASYHRLDEKRSASELVNVRQVNQENISRASSMFQEEEIFQTQELHALSATRSAPPDFVPIIGPAPNFSAMRENYLTLMRNKKTKFKKAQNKNDYHEGLYLTVGHGSNGAATCPLGGEIIASLVSKDPLPVSGQILDELSASRFIIRDLKKQKK
jgi:tRNA 5-methylaminomethyl-2-thiouridine biosynthesis bifunctional protein